MKVLFVFREIRHLSYYESIVTAVSKKAEHIQILFDKEWSKEGLDYAQKCILSQIKNVRFEWMMSRSDKWQPILLRLRELRTYGNYLIRKNQSEYYTIRWQKYILSIFHLSSIILHLITPVLKLEIVRNILAYIEQIIPPDRKIVEFLLQERPDIVVAGPANLRFDNEIEYVKAAKYMRIPTIIPVISWDNLSTKGLFHVLPDVLLVWNNEQKKEAVELHGFLKNQIRITGSPFFYKWDDGTIYKTDKERFFKENGLFKGNKYILYLGSSANIAPDEAHILKDLSRQIEANENKTIRNLMILFRPHPANYARYQKLKIKNVIPWHKSADFPDSIEAKRNLYNSIKYCIAAVGINTSAMLDTIILGKPCICILDSTFAKTQVETTHFRQLLQYNALEVVDNVTNGIQAIKRILSGIDKTSKSRNLFIQEFVRPLVNNKLPGEIAADIILQTAKKV